MYRRYETNQSNAPSNQRAQNNLNYDNKPNINDNKEYNRHYSDRYNNRNNYSGNRNNFGFFGNFLNGNASSTRARSNSSHSHNGGNNNNYEKNPNTNGGYTNNNNGNNQNNGYSHNSSIHGTANRQGGHNTDNRTDDSRTSHNTAEQGNTNGGRKQPNGGKNPLLSFIPSSVYNPDNKKIFGFLTADDLLIVALIIMFLDSDEEGDNLMVYALLFVLISGWFDFDLSKFGL